MEPDPKERNGHKETPLSEAVLRNINREEERKGKTQIHIQLE